MPKGIVRFTQAEIVRAIRAFHSAGLEVGAIRLNSDGTIEIVAMGYETARSEGD
jgi:acylphosphatase